MLLMLVVWNIFIGRNELRSIAMADILEEALDKRANIDNLGKN